MSDRHAPTEVCYLCGRCQVDTSLAARICESRASSLAAGGNIVAANEALKCAEAIRRSAMSQ